MPGRLAGKVAIITGAASGIGAASARLFAAEGARLALADVTGERVSALVAEIAGNGGAAFGQQTDVTVARYQRLDVLFSNAGIGGAGVPVAEMDEADWHRILSVNLTGGFLCAKYAVPHLVAGGGGSVIFTASELALVGSPGGAAYCASKAGLIGMARAMALDHGPDNVRVSCLCPGAMSPTGRGKRRRWRRAWRCGGLGARRRSPAPPSSSPATTPPSSPAPPSS